MKKGKKTQSLGKKPKMNPVRNRISNGMKKSPKIKKLPRSVLAKYKKLLIKERSKVSGGLSYIASTTLNKSQREASGDLSGYAYHMADMASDDYEREFSLGRATDEQKILFLIDEAMKRIDDGTYGNCLQCGKAIAPKRLAALPYSELCIKCQESNEGK